MGNRRLPNIPTGESPGSPAARVLFDCCMRGGPVAAWVVTGTTPSPGFASGCRHNEPLTHWAPRTPGPSHTGPLAHHDPCTPGPSLAEPHCWPCTAAPGRGGRWGDSEGGERVRGCCACPGCSSTYTNQPGTHGGHFVIVIKRLLPRVGTQKAPSPSWPCLPTASPSPARGPSKGKQPGSV